MLHSPLRIGLLTSLVTLMIFSAVRIFAYDQDYYHTSIWMNAFVLPFVYMLAAFWSVWQMKKKGGRISFKKAFNSAFTPMFVGGTISILGIFIYLHIIAPDVRNTLNQQYLNQWEASLEKDYQDAAKVLKKDSEDWKELQKDYQTGKDRIKVKRERDEDMFSAQNFLSVFAGFLIYYLVLSVFFGSFFRDASQ